MHLLAALVWAAVVTLGVIVSFGRSNPSLARDLLVVGGAGGFVFQALLGASSFLLPSTRPPVPEQRRRELTAMELGGRIQVLLYNLGLLAILVGLETGLNFSVIGIALAWSAAVFALAKLWFFPLLAKLPGVATKSEEWWAPPAT